MMKDKLTIREMCRAQIIRNRPTVDILNIKGRFRAEHFRRGRLIDVYDVANTVMNVAKNALWDTYFNAMTQVAAASHFMSLISSAGYSAIAAADTAASHAGWTEATAYAAATRPVWGQGAAASQQITNASPVSFVASSGFTAKGLFLITESTKGAGSGLLFCAGLFTAGDAVLAASDELRVTYTGAM
jgi:hypothetical protein